VSVQEFRPVESEAVIAISLTHFQDAI